MKITRDNYEAYLLDRQEGRLSQEEVQELKAFLLAHPDCVSFSLEDDSWTLEPSNLAFPGKEGLKKEFPTELTEVNHASFDMISLARLEGDLDARQEKEHEKLLAGDASLRKEWEAWQRTLLPVNPVVYPAKDSLKKSRKTPTRYLWMSGAAAAAATVLFLLFFLRQEPLQPTGQMALENPALPDLPAATDREPAAEPVTGTDHSPQSSAGSTTDPVPGSSPDTGQEGPVLLRFRKHQDPPERREYGKATIYPTDTTFRLNPAEVRAGSVRMAYYSGMGPGLYTGSVDQIRPLELPPMEVSQPPRGLREATRAYIQDRDITLLSIASAGIEGINRLTGSEMGLALSKKESGEVSGIRFRSDLLSVVAPVGKSE
jgi:hypothetical protein